MKQPYKLFFIFIFSFLLVTCLIYLQNTPLFIDVSTKHSLKPSQQLINEFEKNSTPVKFTFFCSDSLLKDLELAPIINWLNLISNKITTIQINPIKFPAKADHYDITSDGIIVIEANDKRFDIDIIDLVLTHADFSLQTLQNTILQRLLNLTASPAKQILLIHTSPTSLLENTEALGLASLYLLLAENNIVLNEVNLNSLTNLTQPMDAIILYKLDENANEHINQLQKLINFSPASILISHPKHAKTSNLILDENLFNSEIIHDSQFHLIHSKNQLIVDYKTRLNRDLIMVLPYSAFISFDETSDITAIANSSNDSYVTFDDNKIPGPFTIIASLNQYQRLLINNHLLITNYWLSQANNAEAIEDILFSLIQSFPLVSNSFDQDATIILTYNLLFKQIFLLIILPIILILFLDISTHIKRRLKK